MTRIQWIPDPNVLRGYFLKLWVDVRLLDEAWRNDPTSYIDYGGDGYSEDYARVAASIRSSLTATMPIIGITQQEFHIQSGRHTIAFLRDHGAVAIQVMAPKAEAGEVHRLFRSAGRETVLTREPVVVP